MSGAVFYISLRWYSPSANGQNEEIYSPDDVIRRWSSSEDGPSYHEPNSSTQPVILRSCQPIGECGSNSNCHTLRFSPGSASPTRVYVAVFSNKERIELDPQEETMQPTERQFGGQLPPPKARLGMLALCWTYSICGDEQWIGPVTEGPEGGPVCRFRCFGLV